MADRLGKNDSQLMWRLSYVALACSCECNCNDIRAHLDFCTTLQKNASMRLVSQIMLGHGPELGLGLGGNYRPAVAVPRGSVHAAV